MVIQERTSSGRAWGWVSGLGWLAAPWIGAGIISTFLPDPEASFPGVFIVALAAMIGWLVYGSIRIQDFRRAALKGVALSTAFVVVLVLLLRTAA